LQWAEWINQKLEDELTEDAPFTGSLKDAIREMRSARLQMKASAQDLDIEIKPKEKK
jgi:hypothetical protein